MKTHIKIFASVLAAVAVMSLSSCSEEGFFDVKAPSAADESNVYSNYTLSEYAIFSISETFGHTNNYRGRFLPWYGFNTDVEWYNGTNTTGKQLAQYNPTTNNTQLNLDNGPYNEMFVGIERANLAIEGLRTYGDIENQPDMAYLLGEALTLRAMIYYDLIKAWGDVPARFEPINSDNIFMAKSSRDTIFVHILADLEEAINYLYWPGQSTQTATTDRINKAFACGLYARIALFASGYALRPENGTVGTGNVGSVRKTDEPQLQASVLYPNALKYLKMVIESGTAHLESSYEQLWRNFNNYDLTAGKEVLYSIPFSDGRGRWNYHFAGSHEGTAYIGTAANRGGDVGPVPTLYFKYEAQDTRRDVSCVNFNWIEDGQEPAGIDMWYFGKYRFEWMDVQPYGGGNDDGLKPVVMRYSDILLMAAEITNELGNLNEAKDFLSQVRERAYAGNESMVTNYINGLADKNAVFNAIVDERALEFVGEFLRKADLIRWNLLNTKLDEAKAEMTALAQRTDEVYYSYNADGMGLTFWGLDPAQSGISPEGSQWILAEDYFSDFDTELIDAMYQADPNQHMFWPIFDITLTNSQGYLKNDYGY
ncbi:MAG TPA: RagB/SusD family nutrient uptake outer membrane protein [Candidatus Coprenecus avistercoris]|uniref:RagB/SusD family nutrient uptake outer membrane protein n=1 Tax=Candidatus Coprenecus avistercoris TaxID=2840730 RepID=A0A9D1E097_9BACT|nr:RagB/SusD family nutrient uptake outer membrane protein [Candidatus Coprenecus avistercoris]